MAARRPPPALNPTIAFDPTNLYLWLRRVLTSASILLRPNARAYRSRHVAYTSPYRESCGNATGNSLRGWVLPRIFQAAETNWYEVEPSRLPLYSNGND